MDFAADQGLKVEEKRPRASGTSLDKNTSCQGRGVGIQEYSKEYKDTNENNKMEKHIGQYQEEIPGSTEISHV